MPAALELVLRLSHQTLRREHSKLIQLDSLLDYVVMDVIRAVHPARYYPNATPNFYISTRCTNIPIGTTTPRLSLTMDRRCIIEFPLSRNPSAYFFVRNDAYIRLEGHGSKSSNKLPPPQFSALLRSHGSHP